MSTEIKRLFDNIQIRERMLTDTLKQLRTECEKEYERVKNIGGVITPGYFSFFYPILDKYKQSGIISGYHLTQEQYSNNGEMVSVPIIDVVITTDGISNNYRIFVLSTIMARDLKISFLVQ
jgi:hypothetical protein